MSLYLFGPRAMRLDAALFQSSISGVSNALFRHFRFRLFQLRPETVFLSPLFNPKFIGQRSSLAMPPSDTPEPLCTMTYVVVVAYITVAED